MGQRYHQRPSVWADIGDPDLAREYDEAAYEVGTTIERIDGATKQETYTPPSKVKPTRTVRRYARSSVLWVLGYVHEDLPQDDGEISAHLYAQLMGDLDGHPPSA